MRHRLIFRMEWAAVCLLLIGSVGCDRWQQVDETTPISGPQATSWPDEIGPETSPQLGSATMVNRPAMTVARAAHTATRLEDGTVLLVGGFSQGEQALASAELFDPTTSEFSSTGALSTARQSHTGTLLPNGKLLIAGGFDGDYLASAELFDIETGRFTPTGSMGAARSGHTAVLLPSGQVLVAGGTGVGWSFLASAELYDPVTGVFTPSGPMTVPRESHTATLLNSGQLLITGGHEGRRAEITIYESAELYDPVRGTFSATASMTIKRHKHDATLLADGRVLISGGADERDAAGAYRTTEIYDPASGAFTRSGAMRLARYKHTGTSLLLRNGRVLLIGGASTPEVFDPSSGASCALAVTGLTTRLFATATLLANGEVLFAGGYGAQISGSGQAWLLQFDPSAC